MMSYQMQPIRAKCHRHTYITLNNIINFKTESIENFVLFKGDQSQCPSLNSDKDTLSTGEKFTTITHKVHFSILSIQKKV